MNVKILLIERKHTNLPSFALGLLRKEYHVVPVRNGSLALEEMTRDDFDVVIINAASMRTTGKRICQSIQRVEEKKHIPIILIIDEESDVSDVFEADVVLQLPFTLQKLVNRIRPFEPSDLRNSLEVGGLILDENNRCIHYNGVQTSLTPRLLSLLKILMEHPGEVIRREDIFRAVWETDFVADMRTLDVHVSWLRQAIEEDPRRPKMIKTVRGVGYKLSVEA